MFSILINRDKLVYKCHFSLLLSLEVDEVTKSEQPPCHHEGDKNKGKTKSHREMAALTLLDLAMASSPEHPKSLFVESVPR